MKTRLPGVKEFHRNSRDEVMQLLRRYALSVRREKESYRSEQAARASDLARELGEFHAFRFISGEGDPDDGDYSGNVMCYPPWTDVDGDNFTIFSMFGGVVTVGWNADDGKFYFGLKTGWLDEDGYWLNSSNTPGDINKFKFTGPTIVTPGAIYMDLSGNIRIAPGEGPAGFGDVILMQGVQVPNDSILYSMIQDVVSANVVLGRKTGDVGGIIEEIACSAAGRALIDDSSAAVQRATLDLEIGVDVQAWDANLDTLAGLTPGLFNFIVGPVAYPGDWESVTPAVARTRMGVAIGKDVQAWDADLNLLATCTPTANGDFIVGAGFPAAGPGWYKKTAAETRGFLGLGAVLTGQAGEDTIDAASTEYLPLSGVAAANVYARRCFIVPFAGTAQNLYVRTTTSQPVGGNLVMTVQKNNANTVVTVTVAAGGAAAITADVTHSFAFDKGDRLTLAAVNNAGSNVSAGISAISLELLKDV